MSEVIVRTRTTHRVEIVVPNPTDWSQVDKAMLQARKQLVKRAVDPNFDDSVHVRADEDEIVFWFELPEAST